MRHATTSTLPSARRRFGRFELRPGEGALLADGVPVALGARAFDLLVALANRAGTLIAKDELLATVWPGVVVEENNLQVQVSTLRKILGNRAIATLPGRGYRFTLPVEHDPPGPSCALPAFRNNLPAQLNSFVGREPQIAQLK